MASFEDRVLITLEQAELPWRLNDHPRLTFSIAGFFLVAAAFAVVCGCTCSRYLCDRFGLTAKVCACCSRPRKQSYLSRDASESEALHPLVAGNNPDDGISSKSTQMSRRSQSFFASMLARIGLGRQQRYAQIGEGHDTAENEVFDADAAPIYHDEDTPRRDLKDLRYSTSDDPEHGFDLAELHSPSGSEASSSSRR